MFKLIQKNNPQNYYETHKDSFLVGKSERCEIVIGNPDVSDIQAKVGTKNNRYFIKNMGHGSISVNGRETGGQFIDDGDEIALGKTTFLIQLANKDQQSSDQIQMEAKTMVLDTRAEETVGPRLVCTTSSGKSKIIPLRMQKLIIGRSSEATLKLLHPSISRKHCVIEKQNKGYVARNISTTSPVYINDQSISEQRLYTGDQLRVGTFTITFISDRSADARRIEKKVITQKIRSSQGLWLTGLLIVIFGSYLFFEHAYTPWQIRHTLDTVASQIETGEYQPAKDTLKQLLHKDLSPDNAQAAKGMLAQITMAIIQDKAEKGDIKEAKKYLKSYLAEHGHGKEAEALWDRLDFYRLTLGEQLESLKKYQPALREYSAIREDSLYFEEAQKAIRRIWLAYQQKSRQQQTVAQLLKEAETHFLAKRYLTPVNKNAYAVYQAILALKADHELALQRIEQIKTFYREHGEGYFNKGNWSKALSYFERYSIIDPESPDIKEKISICRQKLVAARKRSRKSGRGAKAASNKKQQERREEIQRLLEESGTESSRIMKYLFEEQEGEKKSDTPW
jgi:pSer/pThr/pTyr-binding forkhead associated (FHA) protein/tetratricopeptide (TPR) repeat protein